MDGDLYIKFTGEKQLQQMTARVPEANEHGQTVYSSKKIAVNPGSTIGAGFALTIKADEFEDMAKLDYSKFDDNKAREILDSKDDLFDKLNQAVDSIDPSFRLNKNAVFADMKFSAEFV